jgi:hypothetical protein
MERMNFVRSDPALTPIEALRHIFTPISTVRMIPNVRLMIFGGDSGGLVTVPLLAGAAALSTPRRPA